MAARGRRHDGRDYDENTKPRKSDERERRGAARDREGSYRRLYKLGLAGDKPFDFDALSEPERHAYEAGEEDAALGHAKPPAPKPGAPSDENSTQEPAAGEPSPQRRPAAGSTRSTSSMVAEGSGFLLGLIAYAALINFIRGGPAQLRGWVGAKFLNRPYGAAVPSASRPATPSTPTRPSGPTTTPAGVQLIPASYQPPSTAPIAPGLLR